ncbi:uncharacterized protein LOC111499491 [Cucurbita maxima]|uniref:Uncharacterized protein LOC111499491 n=1 Tax=Cucurbita maxima TaxID=3661 RepID=A0A6J1KWW2_CUCMA|nr:uncharacterized protein LOC111499491 [Cucurbita maxima]
MLNFMLDSLEPFTDVISILQRFDHDTADLEGSPTMFSIIISLASSPPSLLALQIMPQFFSCFSCDQLHYVNVPIAEVATIISNMKRDGFYSLVFFLLANQERIAFAFKRHSQQRRWDTRQLKSEPLEPKKVGEIDYTSFVSIDLEEFRSSVITLCAGRALVTITNSEISFDVPYINREIILSKEKGECIIGGFEEGEKVMSEITLFPIKLLNSSRLKRLWIFKTNDSSVIILILEFIALFLDFIFKDMKVMIMDIKGVGSAKLCNQNKWAEADATFLQRLSLNKNMTEISSSSSHCSSLLGFETNRNNEIFKYSRQRFLRSYTFSVEEKKTKRFGKARKWFNLKSRTKSTSSNNVGKSSYNGILNFMLCCTN